MAHKIDVIPNSECKPRCPSTYDKFKHQISEKIITELDTGKIVHSKSSNSIGMIILTKRLKPREVRFLLDCLARNVVTHTDMTPMPSMHQILDFLASRPFKSKLDLTDGHHNIRIHSDSVGDSTFTYQIGKFDSLVMQQGDCNAPATIMRAMNYQFREVKDPMIYLDHI